jgi:hypothetical protein
MAKWSHIELVKRQSGQEDVRIAKWSNIELVKRQNCRIGSMRTGHISSWSKGKMVKQLLKRWVVNNEQTQWRKRRPRNDRVRLRIDRVSIEKPELQSGQILQTAKWSNIEIRTLKQPNSEAVNCRVKWQVVKSRSGQIAKWSNNQVVK